jgi:hypothetical protein
LIGKTRDGRLRQLQRLARLVLGLQHLTHPTVANAQLALRVGVGRVLARESLVEGQRLPVAHQLQGRRELRVINDQLRGQFTGYFKVATASCLEAGGNWP